MHFLAVQFVFSLGDDRGILEDGVKTVGTIFES